VKKDLIAPSMKSPTGFKRFLAGSAIFTVSKAWMMRFPSTFLIP